MLYKGNCIQPLRKCGITDDCCYGSYCSDGTCDYCTLKGQGCNGGACCDGLICQGGNCVIPTEK